ncbi:hypothetical protein [Consotaella salsifontis]|uniref:Curlin associated repeat-containing protein n=1 Tax=Consotaella salsifontis TaxID=1365950 RepID=A0A1T4SFA1_9HYPH|nr:hypothetical protein [Consotaella salsifontis]SKA26867.1 Curlin associated repeat-containing protein [Consotaella salsifontis]
MGAFGGMKFGRRELALALAGGIVAFATPALAQSAGDNSVSIGQTGDTNTIGIVQDGNRNVVGGPADGLPLGQDGRYNQISITQTGSGNSVDTNTRQGVRPSLGLVVTGTGQTGDRNEIDIIQETPLGGLATTVIEAIRQEASAAFAAAAAASNRLVLRQTSLAGAQSVGQVIQKNTVDRPGAGVTNLVSITQDGAGTGAGNSLITALQEGFGNSAAVIQTQSGQRIETINQVGSNNGATLEQSRGLDNTVLAIEQMGMANQLRLLQSGSRNVVGKVMQNNDGVAIAGNEVTLTLAGRDNGGDGRGGLGAFALLPAAWDGFQGWSLFQGLISQIGDGNSVSYVTSDASSKNLYGIVQDGDGNGAIGTVSGTGNELALRQTGGDNNIDFRQDGTDNAAAADLRGERNQLRLVQSGAGNALLASVGTEAIKGSDNSLSFDQSGSDNSARASVLGSLNRLSVTQSGKDNQVDAAITGSNNNAVGGTVFTGERLTSALGAKLQPGDISQSGSLNGVDLVLSGDLNAFAFSQKDQDNRIYAVIEGSGNQAVVTQAGSGNVASFSQHGKGNGLSIQQ